MAKQTDKQTPSDRVLTVLKRNKKGLTAAQIAEKLNCTPNSVGPLLARLRRRGVVEGSQQGSPVIWSYVKEE